MGVRVCCFVRRLGFVFLLDIWVLKNPIFPAEKETFRQRLGRGTSNTCAKCQSLVSLKRRGYFGFCALKVVKSRPGILITWLQ